MLLMICNIILKNPDQSQNSEASNHSDTNPIPELQSLSLAGPSIDEVLIHKKKVTHGQGMLSHLTGELQYLTEGSRGGTFEAYGRASCKEETEGG